MKQYSEEQILAPEATEILKTIYSISGKLDALPGDVDFNFCVDIKGKYSYILKISRIAMQEKSLKFQQSLLKHIESYASGFEAPRLVAGKNGHYLNTFVDPNGNTRFVQLLTWVSGILWSSYSPYTYELRKELGEKCGKLQNTLSGFEHSAAHRDFEWDIASSIWVKNHTHLFSEQRQHIINYFIKKFEEIQPVYNKLPKAIIHNDINDNNIVIEYSDFNTKIKGFIDYGDAIYSQRINDVAIASAYSIMNTENPLEALKPLVVGYHSEINFLEEELTCLYILIAMRLIITITKSELNRQREPNNKYLFVSEKPAWELLEKWVEINESFALYTVRDCCSLTPHPNEGLFKKITSKLPSSLHTLFPNVEFDELFNIDLSVSSTFLGNKSDYENGALAHFKIQQFQAEHRGKLITGGYKETRPFYSNTSYERFGNEGQEYRTAHLGIDFWVPERTEIRAPIDGVVFSLQDNNHDKDYGPTLILKHTVENVEFYTLYGHLSRTSLKVLTTGENVRSGYLIGYVGAKSENGGWIPHLHFQVVLDMLDNKHNFIGVAYPNELSVWASICPNPMTLFSETLTVEIETKKQGNLVDYRRKHLGKGLSLSYSDPLHIVRGDMQYLLDVNGQRYLDTVNNVAHVGHEHPRVVMAGQKQMAVLNTNSRYLHENIIAFADNLLATLPSSLSVVHFVNSGSEANELAIRMARNFTGQRDIIAVESGYHGNTTGCIDISSYKFDGRGGSGAPEYTHIVPLPDTFRGYYSGDNAGERYANHVEEKVHAIQNCGRNVSAFFCESMISCGGQIDLPKDYLKHAYAHVHSAGGVCIADEVQVGFGRVGHTFWAFEKHEIIPDIITMGKPIGNGHPMAAVVCTAEIASAFANGMEYFNTFGGNPVSSAIGLEVLNVIKDENLQENARIVGAKLKNALLRLQKEFPIIADVRGDGLFLGFELTDSEKNPLPKHTEYLADRMKDNKVLMSTDGPDHNVIKIKPPMCFSEENISVLISLLQKVLSETPMRLY